MKFSTRDLLWLTLVAAIALGWWRDHRALQDVHLWWIEHVNREHSSNPNDHKRLLEREWPPHGP